MWALDIHFTRDKRNTRLIRFYHTIEDLVQHAPAPAQGLTAEAVEVPEAYCSNMEHPCTTARLMRYFDTLSEDAKVRVA